MTQEIHGPSAKIIADSISEQGHRLTTMEVVMHRFVLAEFNTHRVFSRNSASSRAIPYEKPSNPNDPKITRNRVTRNPAIPVSWPSEQPGMSGGDQLDEASIQACEAFWLSARDRNIGLADMMFSMGLHKSVINRILEPFMWHTAVVTSTEWDNFFWQRCDPAAQPEMKAVADKMQLAYYGSKPTLRVHGDWHLPYIKHEDRVGVIDVINEGDTAKMIPSEMRVFEALKAVSTTRCARVSYLTQAGVRDLEEDLKLYERLKRSGHWSPFEHVATPILSLTSESDSNFHGWKQHRKEFHTENRVNFLPNLPELAQVRMRMEAGLNPWAS